METISSDIIESCGSVGIAGILSITKTVLNIIQIVGPILSIVGLAVCFVKLTVNPDDKKYKAGLKNSLISLVVLFMVPFLVNLSMSMADNTFDLATCWNHAEEVASLGEDSEYVEIHEDKKENIVRDDALGGEVEPTTP